eukprot:gene15700-21809_t
MQATSIASATSTGIPTTASAVSSGGETVVDIAVDGEKMYSGADGQYDETAGPLRWDEAPQCQGDMVQGEFVEDSVGRPWGWEEDTSCAYKSYPAGKVYSNIEPAPTVALTQVRLMEAMENMWMRKEGSGVLKTGNPANT